MTILGKILTLILVALSLACFLVGLGIYTYSIDWGWTATYTRKDFDTKIKSEIDQRKDTLAELADFQGRNLAALKIAHQELQETEHGFKHPDGTVEPSIAARQREYARELERIRAGADFTVQDLRKRKPWLFDKKQKPWLDRKPWLAKEAPRMGPPLFDSDATKSYHGYVTELNSVLTKISTIRKQVDQVLADQKRLTEELVGKEDNAGKRENGLYALITGEQDVQKRAREEINDVKPLYYQELIDSQLLRDRQDSLRYRLRELENLKTAKK